MLKVIGVCAVVLTASSAALAGRPNPDALDRFDRTGETAKCVFARTIDITAIDESRLLFRVGPGEFYLNETRSACNGAADNFSRFEMNRFGGSEMCSGEILKIVDNASGIYQGACSLGDFEKLAKKSPDDADDESDE